MVTFIKNITIINEGLSFIGSLLIKDERINKIINSNSQAYLSTVDEVEKTAENIIEGHGLYLIPGVIDDQVHFREPGNTNKGDIESESAAAVLGGVTSYMDMPNNNPATCTIEALEKKYDIAQKASYANYSFYLGASNENISEILKVDPSKVCGIKVFMGSSTGNMLVDKQEVLEEIFKNSPALIATHCEDEAIIKTNLDLAVGKYGEEIPFSEHSSIRSRQACIKSTTKAIELALKYNSRLHILHISTEEELELLGKAQVASPKITGEVCIHYLWFNSADYNRYKYKIKCNPAIKDERDMLAIRNAVKSGIVSAVATDHAPHLLSEKENTYLKSPSGLPLVQHSLGIMLRLSNDGVFTKAEVVNMMCHSPAKCFGVIDRGYIREGYFADLAILRIESENTFPITKEDIHYKCKWSPLEGEMLNSKVIHTFVNGKQVVKDSNLLKIKSSRRIKFRNESTKPTSK